MNCGNTAPSAEGSYVEESGPIHWDFSWVPCFVMPLVNFFSFLQVMEFWECTFKWGTLMSKIIIADIDLLGVISSDVR